MIGIVLIATGGPRYTQYVLPLVQSIRRYLWEAETIIFTDNPDLSRMPYDILFKQEDLGWPNATLLRYHMMLKHDRFLLKYDHLFYMDVDMLLVSKIEPEEIISDGITAVTHPGFPTSFERNPKSRAYVPGGNHPYYQGCFQGGKTEVFLDMAANLQANIDEDTFAGIKAIWHDESYLNQYLNLVKPPSKVLSPAYAYPEEKYLVHPETWKNQDTIIKIRHLEKTDQYRWKNGPR